MSLEKTRQHTLAVTKYEEVKQDLLTSWNASVALDNNLGDFFKIWTRFNLMLSLEMTRHLFSRK
ncbi:hypothetical protein LAA29_180176 [Leuconostoc carnosum]|nr:hypothetical protein LCAC16_270175 [Leuconostoc carnosum]SPO33973.1 hypothetical protein LAA29_180176 [Leuconostoc carnosum]